jgi:hypothetical protein
MKRVVEKDRRLTVVVASDLLLVLGLGVHDDLRREAEEDIVEEVGREVERDKVVSVLEDLKDIA